MLAAIDRGMGLALYSKLGADELRGAKLGVDVPTSGFAFAMYRILDDLGLPRSEYDLVALGSTPKRLTALLAGDCAATMLNAGNELLAEAAGYRALGRAPQPYLGTVLVALSPQDELTAALVATADADPRRRAGRGRDRRGRGRAGRARPAVPRRLKSPADGLVAGGAVDPAAMATVEELRRKYGSPA